MLVSQKSYHWCRHRSQHFCNWSSNAKVKTFIINDVINDESHTGMRRAPRKLIACISETGTGSGESTSGSSSSSELSVGTMMVSVWPHSDEHIWLEDCTHYSHNPNFVQRRSQLYKTCLQPNSEWSESEYKLLYSTTKLQIYGWLHLSTLL